MSIVILKRKSDAMYKNMSVGSTTGFSLNGTHRNQGYVGQTMLSRSLPRTPMKGNVAKGHGGCCGKYPQNGIIQSAVTSLNDPSIVKPSVQTTSGMLRTHYQWIWRPQPYSSTKIDSTHNSNPQSTYIRNISVNTAKVVDASSNVYKITCPKQCMNLPKEALPKNVSHRLVQPRNPGNYVKENMTRPEKNNPLLGISSSKSVNIIYTQNQYIDQLYMGCTSSKTEVTTSCNNKMPLNTHLKKTPLIGGNKSF
jgi:hypothetical protein